VTIQPYSGSDHKNWPLAKFQELARELEKVMPVFWNTGPGNPTIEGAVRHCNLYDLACWYSRARILISNDTGPSHLAAAVGTTTVVMWGHEGKTWRPRGRDVLIARFFGEFACMESELREPTSSLQEIESQITLLRQQEDIRRLSAQRKRAAPVKAAATKPEERLVVSRPDLAFDLAALRNKSRPKGCNDSVLDFLRRRYGEIFT
jgi:uncharacterized small protein (DUF1192 family)